MSRNIERRAARLVALYPRDWRDRFGEEFEQLMIDEMRERRCCLRRDGDVLVHALLAQLTAVGVAGGRLTSPVQAGRALRLLGVVVVGFFTLGVGMWTQVRVGWAWASPSARGTRIAMVVMSAALIALAVLLALATLFVLAGVVGAARQRTVGPVWPLLVSVFCVVTLAIGCWHLGSRWPDAGSLQWSRQSVVPAQLARLGWAGTLFINADWAHPATLLRLSAGLLAWMIASPAMAAVAIGAAVAGLRRSSLSERIVHATTVLAAAGVAVGCLFVAGAAAWILNGDLGPRRMFAPGSVDCLGLASLVVMLLLAGRLTHRGLDALLTRPGA